MRGFTDTAHQDLWPRRVEHGWECVSMPAGRCATPADWPASGWIAAQVPGTVAGAWRAAGKLDMANLPAFAFDDHWYRVTLDGHGSRRLRLHGLATLAEVWLDGVRVLDSDSMFVAHDLDLMLDGSVQLALCFRSLAPALAARRGRARWRPRLVNPPTLRNLRTTALGHMPGWCPPIQAAGPWRPVELLGDAPDAFDTVDLSTSLEGDDGIVSLTLRFVHPHPDAPPAMLACAGAHTPLQWLDAHTLRGRLRVAHAPRWWPHTHGSPTLHDVTLQLQHDFDESRDSRESCERHHPLGRVGFRSIEVERGADGEGFGLRINGTSVFCRGACWTNADLATLTGTDAQLTHTLTLARDAGLNMLRIGGTMLYESDNFYAIADRLGILIWQEFAFANFDYPTDDAFIASAEREAVQFVARTRRFASLAVLCGGSEIEQQAAMLGLPPSMRAQPLFTERLPAIVARERPDVPYVAHSPSGGSWPFSTRTGVTHYYGVGAYQRPLDDARRAEVRFASECLAFANVPDDATLNHALGTIHVHDPKWKAASPRDPGASWDFDDVRDFYLQTVYRVEPARLRYEDPQRYLDLSRAVVAEVMHETFAEWRRDASTCAGALVWQLQDLRPGAGWGLIDSTGRPKSGWHALAQTLQPVQLLITDEGLNGLDLHLINERDQPLRAQLELVCLRDGAVKVVSAFRVVELLSRTTERVSAADLLGQFFDFTHAYRFGPRAHDITIATLRDPDDGTVIAESFHLTERSAQERYDVGLTVQLEAIGDGWQLVIEAQRFARFVHIADDRYRAARDWFHLAPNRPVIVPLLAICTQNVGTSNGLTHTGETPRAPQGEVRAINTRTPVFYG
ncbi:glycoside hydrolase family 2 protein [Paraburkholderia sp.]|uniref:glycosyl hydrolase 2 galactose-binding domain-containing protein n=1 Tax=Paraburkholderia sp. TaxID=1926495 RepID=UPI0023A57EC4|nr:glycoside hydrolase family 2 protein [Paraburkholderia sp.]MDE1184678.1 glycoside hydrolase family 2 protein [Paraburkholderia sp.]